MAYTFDHRIQENSEEKLEPIHSMTAQGHKDERDGAGLSMNYRLLTL